jgi:hypothetical protein
MELKQPEQQAMKVAKEILKQALPGGLGEALSNLETVPMDPRDILTLMPEFANRLVKLIDGLCRHHASETLSVVMPLLSGFTEVLGEAANRAEECIAEEKAKAEKAKAEKSKINLDDHSLN